MPAPRALARLSAAGLAIGLLPVASALAQATGPGGNVIRDDETAFLTRVQLSF